MFWERGGWAERVGCDVSYRGGRVERRRIGNWGLRVVGGEGGGDFHFMHDNYEGSLVR